MTFDRPKETIMARKKAASKDTQKSRVKDLAKAASESLTDDDLKRVAGGGATWQCNTATSVCHSLIVITRTKEGRTLTVETK